MDRSILINESADSSRFVEESRIVRENEPPTTTVQTVLINETVE
jgi:hypothetical protein